MIEIEYTTEANPYANAEALERARLVDTVQHILERLKTLRATREEWRAIRSELTRICNLLWLKNRKTVADWSRDASEAISTLCEEGENSKKVLYSGRSIWSVKNGNGYLFRLSGVRPCHTRSNRDWLTCGQRRRLRYSLPI